jgi:hypothetical protein
MLAHGVAALGLYVLGAIGAGAVALLVAVFDLGSSPLPAGVDPRPFGVACSCRRYR